MEEDRVAAVAAAAVEDEVAVAGEAVAADAVGARGRVAWEARGLPGRVALVFARAAGTGLSMQLDSLATTSGAPSAARR